MNRGDTSLRPWFWAHRIQRAVKRRRSATSCLRLTPARGRRHVRQIGVHPAPPATLAAESFFVMSRDSGALAAQRTPVRQADLAVSSGGGACGNLACFRRRHKALNGRQRQACENLAAAVLVRARGGRRRECRHGGDEIRSRRPEAMDPADDVIRPAPLPTAAQQIY